MALPDDAVLVTYTTAPIIDGTGRLLSGFIEAECESTLYWQDDTDYVIVGRVFSAAFGPDQGSTPSISVPATDDTRIPVGLGLRAAYNIRIILDSGEVVLRRRVLARTTDTTVNLSTVVQARVTDDGDVVYVGGAQGPTGPTGPRGLQGDPGPTGPAGDDGADGADGVGVPTGGTTGQVLAKNSGTNYDTEWVDAASGGAGGDADTLEGHAAAYFLSADNHVDGTTNHVFTAADDTKLTGIASGATVYTDEQAQDAVGTILVDSAEIDFTYSDATPSITASIIAGSIDETKLDTSTNATLTSVTTKAPLASPTFTGTVTLPVGLTGVLRADTGVVSTDSDVTDLVSAASSTAQGKVELATDAETTTGTDTARAITPANLTSQIGSRVQAYDADLATLAGLTATTDNFIVSVSSAWASRTPAQVKTTLAIQSTDISNFTTAAQTAVPPGGMIVYTQTTTGQPWVLAGGQTADANRPRLFIGPDAPESTFPSYVARDGDTHKDV